MEKIMSKHTSYGAAATSDQTRELTADELDQIAGGTPSIPIPPPVTGGLNDAGVVAAILPNGRRSQMRLLPSLAAP